MINYIKSLYYYLAFNIKITWRFHPDRIKEFKPIIGIITNPNPGEWGDLTQEEYILAKEFIWDMPSWYSAHIHDREIQDMPDFYVDDLLIFSIIPCESKFFSRWGTIVTSFYTGCLKELTDVKVCGYVHHLRGYCPFLHYPDRPQHNIAVARKENNIIYGRKNNSTI